MRDLRFGIEIETAGISRQDIARAIKSVVGGTQCDSAVIDAQGRTWRVVPDGSLSGGYARSGEIVSPILTYQDLTLLQDVVREVRAAGGRADESTGIHIHVDGSRFDGRAVSNLVKIVAKQERLIELALGISARRLARYCRPINEGFLARLISRRPRTLAQVQAAWYGRQDVVPHRYDESRYYVESAIMCRETRTPLGGAPVPASSS